MRACALLPFLVLAGCDVGAVSTDQPHSAGPDGGGGGGGDGDGDVVARYHPAGWAAAEMHAPDLKLQGQDCRGCHGADLTGDESRAAPSCDSCHTPAEPEAWRSDCTFCHGGEADETGAPPRDIDAPSSDISFVAHTAHVTEGIAAAAACSECHVQPVDVMSDGHVFDSTHEAAEVTFGGGRSSQATYDGDTCANVYCHGDGRGDNGSIAKTSGPLPCTGCHATDGTGMSGEHRRHIANEGMACTECHETVVSAADAIIAPALHVDGAREVSFAEGGTYAPANRSCSGLAGGCHGTKSW